MFGRGFGALRKFLRTCLSLNAFLILRIIFGQYCNLGFPTAVSVLARSYCVFVVLFIPYLILRYSVVWMFYQMDVIAFFVLTVVVPLLSGEQPYLRFRAALADADRAARWHRTPNDPCILYVYLSIALLSQITLHIVYQNPALHPLVNFGNSFISIATELEPLVRLSIFGLIYQRMKLLRESFQSIASSGSDTEQNRATQINHNMKIYKRLLDCFEHVDTNMQLTFGITLMRCAYRSVTVLVISWSNVSEDSDNTLTSYDILTFLIYMTYAMLMACVPCLLVELAENEIDSIMRLLARKLAFDECKRVQDAASFGARYLHLRPMRMRLARVLPLNSATPIALVSFCFTYICIQLQLYVF